MIDPITGAGLILALIPLFQRSRDKAAQATAEDFYAWLIEHKFQDVKDCITNNYELVVELECLLRMNQDELMKRFDAVDAKLFSIMGAMSEFKGLIRLAAPRAGLTEQEASILRQFVDSGAANLIDAGTLAQPVCWKAGSVVIEVKNPMVMKFSLEKLSAAGFLLKCESKRGNDYYQLTEQAIDYVAELKKSDLSDQAKSILKQYADSGQNYLCTILDERGGIMIQAENIPIELADPRFAWDDLSSLEKQGYIRFDGDMSCGGKRYTLTRKGSEKIPD